MVPNYFLGRRMETEYGLAAAIVLGFLLGLKHATDADHVVAVATIVNDSKNIRRGLWIGASWGIGHTTPLLVIGILILLFKEVLLAQYERVEHVFEFGVGIMLVFLGLQVYWNLRKSQLHAHEHDHDDGRHVHIHATHDSTEDLHEKADHGFLHFGKPVFRVKSFVIGMVHGLAGSAAVMLALLPTISSFWIGVLYLILFGVGTVLSMSLITLLLGIPFALTGSSKKLYASVTGIAGTVSIVFGVALMSDIAYGTSLLPF
tara:strand:- start:3889 stop:4668 length:780 start_codon:yes stop_codon:yes gene_type:complete